jgi:hypothetical protein
VKSALLLAITWGASLRAQAHGFEERYDLPVPLGYVVAGACATVLLTFLLAVFFARKTAPGVVAPEDQVQRWQPRPAAQRWVWLLRCLGLLVYVVTLVSALWGSRDPLMNLAPTMIWIVWWVGLSFAVLIAGNIWPDIDPWRTLFDMVDACAKQLGVKRGASMAWAWPARLGEIGRAHV